MELKRIIMHSSKAQLMTLIMLVLFMLMLAVLFALAQLNITSNNVVQTLALSSASSNYGTMLRLSANNFAKESLRRALVTLTNYEYTPSLRKGNLISNLSLYTSNLMIAGILPNDTSGYPQNAMGNLTFASYNKSIISLLGFEAQQVVINETMPFVFQTDPYTIKVSYTERLLVNSSGNNYQFNIPVNASIPLNNTPDLFYAQQGLIVPVKISSFVNETSVLGGAYATVGNLLSYAYGTIYTISSSASSGATCPFSMPAKFSTAPLNQTLIIATYNAINLGAGSCIDKYAGLVTYIPPAAPPANVPYLVYASSSNALVSMPNNTKALLYGPHLEMLDIENLRGAIMNKNFFASPFTPSYIDRSSGNFNRQSPNGIFTFSNYDTQVGNFNGAGSISAGTTGLNFPGDFTISEWLKTTSGATEVATGKYNGAGDNYWFGSAAGVATLSVDGPSATSTTLINDNKWHYVVGMRSSGTLYIYVDGAKQPTTGTYSGALNPTGNLVIGNFGTASGYPWSGSIADAQIYSSALSQTQIQQLYQEGISALPVTSNTLVGWWPLNGNPNDYSGTGNNGAPISMAYLLPNNYSRDSILNTPVPTPLSPIPGILGCTSVLTCGSNSIPQLYLGYMPLALQNAFPQTASFKNLIGYFVTPSSLPASNAMTFMWWTFVNSVPPQGAGIGPACCQVYEPAASGATFTTTFDPCSCVGYASCSSYAVLTPPTGTWVMIAYEMSNNALSSYAYSSGQTLTATGTLPSTMVSVPSVQFFINGYCGNPIYYNIDGKIANVQFYNSVLSVSQLNSLYQRGIYGLPQTSNLIAWWPLNDDPKDYSGNNYNTVPSANVIYPYISGSYNNPGLSAITASENEWQAIGIS